MRNFSLRTLSLLLFLATLPLTLIGCFREQATPESVLLAIKEAELNLPAGATYLLSSEEEKARPSDELLGVTFGNGRVPSAFSEVEDAAFYFSLTQTCEFSVFLCQRTSSTEAVAKMCLSRLERLKNALPDQKALLDTATVTVRGRWVLLCVSSDTENALRAFRRTL